MALIHHASSFVYPIYLNFSIFINLLVPHINKLAALGPQLNMVCLYWLFKYHGQLGLSKIYAKLPNKKYTRHANRNISLHKRIYEDGPNKCIFLQSYPDKNLPIPLRSTSVKNYIQSVSYKWEALPLHHDTLVFHLVSQRF